MAEIGQPERQIVVRPGELPVPSELPLDPPVPAPARARPRARAGGAMRRRTTWLRGRALPRLPREATREPRRGWRVWRVVDSPHGPALASWRVGTVWPARGELQSGCFIHGPRPAVQHLCGIHAFDARADALAYAEASQERLMLFDHRPVGIAVGRVSCWGHVSATRSAGAASSPIPMTSSCCRPTRRWPACSPVATRSTRPQSRRSSGGERRSARNAARTPNE